MGFIIVGIVVVLGGALVMLLATGRRRATTGRLSRETRQQDDSTPAAGTELATIDESDEARARADEARAATGAVPAKRASSGVARYEPIDPEELGVTRRQFFNRGVLTGLALGVSGFGAAALAFLWPSTAGGSGTKVTVGSVSDVEASFEKKEPFYNASAKVYIQPYPKDALSKAKKVYGNEPGVLAGMTEGFVALYQKCPHLGCRVPWCQTSQWFECPCHGSKYNRVGEKKGGPAPRGMDRFSMEVSSGNIIVDTAVVVQGPPIGTDTTGQGQEGRGVRVIAGIVPDDFRGWLIAVTLIGMALLLAYLAWRVLSLRRNPTPKDPENLTPFFPDEQLEGPRLERALGWSLIFVMVSALALPVYFVFEPGRQDRLLEDFDEKAAERGATLFANDQSEHYDPTKSLLCANCHGVDGGGGTAPYVLQPELDKCDIKANQANPDVPECLPVSAPWAAPSLDNVLLRFDPEQVFNIITYGRPGTPMPAWGVASGKGVLNTQSVNDLVAYIASLQITSDEAKQRSTKLLDGYQDLWAKNADATAKEAAALQKTADDARATGKSAADVAKLQADADEQKEVAASAAAWSAQVNRMNDGEILFRLNCARCHTKGASYFDPNNLALPPPSPPGSGAFGPNLTNGSTQIQFPNLAGEQEQFEWVARGAPANELYGQRGISSGRMPHFINQLSQKQIDAIIAYERSL